MSRATVQLHSVFIVSFSLLTHRAVYTDVPVKAAYSALSGFSRHSPPWFSPSDRSCRQVNDVHHVIGCWYYLRAGQQSESTTAQFCVDSDVLLWLDHLKPYHVTGNFMCRLNSFDFSTRISSPLLAKAGYKSTRRSVLHTCSRVHRTHYIVEPRCNSSPLLTSCGLLSNFEQTLAACRSYDLFAWHVKSDLSDIEKQRAVPRKNLALLNTLL